MISTQFHNRATTTSTRLDRWRSADSLATLDCRAKLFGRTRYADWLADQHTHTPRGRVLSLSFRRGNKSWPSFGYGGIRGVVPLAESSGKRHKICPPRESTVRGGSLLSQRFIHKWSEKLAWFHVTDSCVVVRATPWQGWREIGYHGVEMVVVGHSGSRPVVDFPFLEGLGAPLRECQRKRMH